MGKISARSAETPRIFCESINSTNQNTRNQKQKIQGSRNPLFKAAGFRKFQMSHRRAALVIATTIHIHSRTHSYTTLAHCRWQRAPSHCPALSGCIQHTSASRAQNLNQDTSSQPQVSISAQHTSHFVQHRCPQNALRGSPLFRPRVPSLPHRSSLPLLYLPSAAPIVAACRANWHPSVRGAKRPRSVRYGPVLRVRSSAEPTWLCQSGDGAPHSVVAQTWPRGWAAGSHRQGHPQS